MAMLEWGDGSLLCSNKRRIGYNQGIHHHDLAIGLQGTNQRLDLALALEMWMSAPRQVHPACSSSAYGLRVLFRLGHT
jgi:hypothetical protein